MKEGMKGKYIITIITGLICMILTALIFIQFKTISQTDITSLENMREDELRDEIASYKLKNEEVDTELKEVNEKIIEYEDTITLGKEASEVLKNELEKSNDQIGKNAVSGQGIIVTLKDTDEAKVDSTDLLTLVNQLRKAGAEAISINEQRVVYNSSFADINNIYISVSGERIVSPYVIKAIGNTTYLSSGISLKQYGYIDTMKAEGVEVTLETSNNIDIQKYNGSFSFDYIEEE